MGQDPAGVAEHDRDDLGFAGQPQRLRDGDQPAVRGGGDTGPGLQVGQGDRDEQGGGGAAGVGQPTGAQRAAADVFQRVVAALPAAAPVRLAVRGGHRGCQRVQPGFGDRGAAGGEVAGQPGRPVRHPVQGEVAAPGVVRVVGPGAVRVQVGQQPAGRLAQLVRVQGAGVPGERRLHLLGLLGRGGGQRVHRVPDHRGVPVADGALGLRRGHGREHRRQQAGRSACAAPPGRQPRGLGPAPPPGPAAAAGPAGSRSTGSTTPQPLPATRVRRSTRGRRPAAAAAGSPPRGPAPAAHPATRRSGLPPAVRQGHATAASPPRRRSPDCLIPRTCV